MKTRHVLYAALIAALIDISLWEFTQSKASAHSGSPTFVTWSDGDQLNATDLNNSLAHLHNTFSAGIVDAHVSSSAAIAHSKLATPSLVPKAYLSTVTTCDGSQAAGTDCGSVESSGFDTVTGAAEATGAAGTYQFNLNYTPANTNFAVIVTPNNVASILCRVGNTATSKPNFKVYCYVDGNPGAVTNTAFSVVVLDQ